MTRLLFIFCLAACYGCQPAKDSSHVAQGNVEKPPVQDTHGPVKSQIGEMAGLSADEEFNDKFNCYLVEENGSSTLVSDSIAIDSYLKLVNGSGEIQTQGPLFELKGSDSVIVMIKQQKAWADVLLDRKSLTVLDIQFPTGSAIGKLGRNAEKFSQQLQGAQVSFTPDNFELTPWDDQIPSKGDVVVDGISGATKLCQAAVDLLNDQLPFYRNYFEGFEKVN